MKPTRPIAAQPAHSIEGSTGWTENGKEQSSRSGGSQEESSVAEPDAGPDDRQVWTVCIPLHKRTFKIIFHRTVQWATIEWSFHQINVWQVVPKKSFVVCHAVWCAELLFLYFTWQSKVFINKLNKREAFNSLTGQKHVDEVVYSPLLVVQINCYSEFCCRSQLCQIFTSYCLFDRRSN